MFIKLIIKKKYLIIFVLISQLITILNKTILKQPRNDNYYKRSHIKDIFTSKTLFQEKNKILHLTTSGKKYNIKHCLPQMAHFD